MASIKPKQTSRVTDIVHWVGLILLIGFTYHHFGPQSRTPITPTAIAIFVAAVFLLLGPVPMRSKE